jgi:hypothetical protein
LWAEIRGRFPGGTRGVLRWDDGVWSGLEPAVLQITRMLETGETLYGVPVACLTPTGPVIDGHSPEAVIWLAGQVFERITSIKGDVPRVKLPPLPPGAIP